MQTPRMRKHPCEKQPVRALDQGTKTLEEMNSVRTLAPIFKKGSVALSSAP